MPNNDYVSRYEAMIAACTDCYCCATIDEFEDTTCPVKQKFMSIPAANVEPVIHCKNCKHGLLRKDREQYIYCTWWDYPMYLMDFCSKASKKENNNGN